MKPWNRVTPSPNFLLSLSFYIRTKTSTTQQCILYSTNSNTTTAFVNNSESSSKQPVSVNAKRQDILRDRWSRLPIPRENLQLRLATLDDRDQVLSIEPDIHYGLDYLPDYYEYIVSSQHRSGIVTVDKASNRVLSFGYAIVNHEGRNLSYAGGRTVKDFRAYSLAARSVISISWGGDLTTRVVLHNQQLGFECSADYLAALANRFATGPSYSLEEPHLVSNPVDFLCSESVCSSTENRLFKPQQYILVAKEPLTFSRGNLLIWRKFLHQVMASYSEPGLVPTGEVTGVSIANWTSVPVGGLHLVLNIYCRTESDAVEHLAGQLRMAVSRLRLSDPQRHRLYISAFVPSHLLFNETLTGLRLHPLLRDLPHSYSPKLACDARIVAWSPGTFV
uniref:Staygreen domain-containing protein n=1 Tax=Macrostomum lignano TaxID=282301 RepID=A0A1I8IS79_9PLAT